MRVVAVRGCRRRLPDEKRLVRSVGGATPTGQRRFDDVGKQLIIGLSVCGGYGDPRLGLTRTNFISCQRRRFLSLLCVP